MSVGSFVDHLVPYPQFRPSRPSFFEAFSKHKAIMLLIDPSSGEIVDANPEASAFYGYSRNQLKSMKIQVINQLTAEQVAAERKLALTEGRNFFIFRHKVADGSLRTVTVHSIPLDFDGRKLLYSIIHDVSKQRDLQQDLWHYQTRLEAMVDLQTQELQKFYDHQMMQMTVALFFMAVLILLLFYALRKRSRAEKNMREARDEAHRANKAKSDFLANMSHELRTPLNSIIGFSHMLQTEVFGTLGSEKNKEYAKIINSSGDHLHRIIGDILDMSKIEAGEENLYEETFDIDEVIHECIDMVSDHAARKDLIIFATVLPDAPLLHADRLKVKQVLLNLLTNAIKFTPDPGEIIIEALRGREGSLLFKVIDTGVGISAKDLKSVLDPFVQTGDTYTRSHEGSGLGLALVQLLMKLHEGTVDVESEVGVGTCVTVQFPSRRCVDQ